MAERKVVSKVTNATLYDDGTILLMGVRLSHPHVGTAMEGKSDDGTVKKNYGVVGMLPKSTHVAAKDLIKKVINELAAKNDSKIPKHLWFLKDGDESEKSEYKNHYTVNTSESNRPSARDRKGGTLDRDEADEMFYGGCWGNVLIRPWFFNGKAKNGKSYPKRICCGIVGVQFVRDDEAFGEGRISDEGVFGDLDEGGGHDGLDGDSDDDL